ncbi:MAG: hypothetical protein IJE25_07995 [Clostridia bacterium]|nr:hypothetical protein [Clostridia bacterium]
MKTYPDDIQKSPDDYLPDFLKTNVRISDPRYRHYIEEYLSNQLNVLDDAEDNVLLASNVIRSICGEKIEITREDMPEHLRVSLTFEVPFFMFDGRVLEAIKAAERAISGIFLSGGTRSVRITVFVEYYSDKKSPHEVAIERLTNEGDGCIERSFYL